MSAGRVERAVQAAIGQGLLPAGTGVPGQDHRPWPVVLLMSLGAWLAALPLLAFAGIAMNELIVRGAGTYVFGALAIAAAILVLRANGIGLFVEQLAVPVLLTGAGLVAYGCFRDLPDAAAAVMLAVAAIALVGAVGQAWLRALLGATAAALLIMAIAAFSHAHIGGGRLWLACHIVAAACVAGFWLQSLLLRTSGRSRAAAALESTLAGWLLVSLAALAFSAGMTFLVGASFGGSFEGEAPADASLSAPAPLLFLEPLASLALAAAAAFWVARHWPSVRGPVPAGVALILIALAGLMPALGAVLALLAVCAASARWRLAGAAALAAAWIVGAFYYELHWTLAIKAALLVAAGAVLASLAWWGERGVRSAAAPAAVMAPSAPRNAPARERDLRLGLFASVVLVLAAINIGVWQKETLLARGEVVYVRLAPADPRSLMQGDYMRLNFALPEALRNGRGDLLADRAPVVVARRDGRGIAASLRLDDGSPLAAGELRIETAASNGRWVLVTDAWYFGEGEAGRYARARFGEFRVDAAGHAVLAGLRGEDLQPL